MAFPSFTKGITFPTLFTRYNHETTETMEPIKTATAEFACVSPPLRGFSPLPCLRELTARKNLAAHLDRSPRARDAGGHPGTRGAREGGALCPGPVAADRADGLRRRPEQDARIRRPLPRAGARRVPLHGGRLVHREPLYPPHHVAGVHHGGLRGSLGWRQGQLRPRHGHDYCHQRRGEQEDAVFLDFPSSIVYPCWHPLAPFFQ